MREELIKLLDKAYAPYSNFQVACVVEMKDGKFIPGVNVENASDKIGQIIDVEITEAKSFSLDGKAI